MILAFTGTVGSGKSYHALRFGLFKVNSIPKRIVVANFPIRYKNEKQRQRWKYVDEISVEDLIRISVDEEILGHEGHGLVIFDEAGTIFNSRDWNIKMDQRKQWIKFFTQSRKFGWDIIFVVQDLRMLDRQIRALCEYEVKHIKMNYYSWFRWLPCTVFAYVWKWCGVKFRGSVQFDVLLPWIAKRYDSMKMFNFDEQTNAMLAEFLNIANGSGAGAEGTGSEGSLRPAPAAVRSG